MVQIIVFKQELVKFDNNSMHALNYYQIIIMPNKRLIRINYCLFLFVVILSDLYINKVQCQNKK